MIKTYTYKLKPNKAVEQKFEEQVSVCRYVFNVARECREEAFKKGVRLNYFDLSKQLTDAKKEHVWLSKVHSQTLQAVLERLELGYKKFFADLKVGKTTSKPKWAKKHKWKSLPFKSIKTTFNGFKLPSFGSVKVFNFKVPKGELRTASIIKEVDGLYLKVVVKEEDIKQVENNNSIVSIDMGVHYLFVSSDGEFRDNPKHLFSYLKELRVENRKLSRMKRGGNNYKKQVKVLQRLYLKVSRVRKDFLHKESRSLANNYSTVIREDLNISKMVKGSKLAKHILDCSWGTFFLMLEYKTNVIKVNPAYTSQKCSKCGHISKENRKTQSLFECVKCGYSDNADSQACQNLLELGQQLVEANAVH
jgi:putative transposase